ncbi:MAG: SH3 domain-containing protein [Planctomycetota bacterium]|nr:MAG: SH3 domain-containing protein [Planctomycetota bacterium]
MGTQRTRVAEGDVSRTGEVGCRDAIRHTKGTRPSEGGQRMGQDGMVRIALGLLLVVAGAAASAAQERDDESFPRPMEVCRDRVHLRAGPSTAYEVVAKLVRGTRVQVIGRAYDWYRVELSTPVPVYVASRLVERKGKQVGIVRADRVNVRARASLQATVLGQLDAGAPVRVLAEQDGWLRIAAPEGIAFYLHERLLVPVAGGALEKPQASGEPAASEPLPTEALSPEQVLARAVALYREQLAHDRIADMSFDAARALFSSLLEREDASAAVREAARRGLRRIRLLETLREEYERSRRALGPGGGGAEAGTAQRAGAVGTQPPIGGSSGPATPEVE